jgi:hypothetical protein
MYSYSDSGGSFVGWFAWWFDFFGLNLEWRFDTNKKIPSA